MDRNVHLNKIYIICDLIPFPFKKRKSDYIHNLWIELEDTKKTDCCGRWSYEAFIKPDLCGGLKGLLSDWSSKTKVSEVKKGPKIL